MAKTAKEVKDEILSQTSDAAAAHIANVNERLNGGDSDEFETLVSGAEFYSFETSPLFIGVYTGNKSIRENDKVDNKGVVIAKAGDIMGYIFADANGEETIIGNSHSIEKAMTDHNVQKGDKLRIEFLGKGENANGQPFNRFKIAKAKAKS